MVNRSNGSIPRTSAAGVASRPVTASLIPLAPGVYAWMADGSSHSDTNSGVVIAADGITIVDAGPTPAASAGVAEAVAELTALPVRRLVLSGSHIDVCGGGTAFPLAAVYGTPQTSHHLDQEPNPDVWQRLHPSSDFTDIVTRPVSHTIAEAAHVCPASIAIPVPGPQFESLVVQVPSAGVVFAGAVAAFGQVPLGYEADFPRWIETLEQMKAWGEIIVPAHGPAGGHEELSTLQDYLQACVDARGDRSRMGSGPWDAWVHAEFTAVNVERAAMLADGDPGPPPSLIAILGR